MSKRILEIHILKLSNEKCSVLSIFIYPKKKKKNIKKIIKKQDLKIITITITTTSIITISIYFFIFSNFIFFSIYLIFIYLFIYLIYIYY